MQHAGEGGTGDVAKAQKAIGELLEKVLSSDEQLYIENGTGKFSLQELASFVRTRNQLRLNQGVASEAIDINSLINKLIENRQISNPDFSAPTSRKFNG